MNISLNWLNEYMDRPIDVDQAERVLTDVGFPLEGREPIGDDWQLDVEVTSNRPDVLCHVGVAREIAAATGRSLQPPPLDLPACQGDVNTLTGVDNRVHDICPMYTARLVRGVKVGPSPDWLRRRIEAVGMRPVNNVVDVTNFVLYELAQPLHAFDFNLLDGKRIIVRRAADAETFHAIDGTKHKLTGDMMVIADAERPVAVAGVMGGLDTEVGDSTTDVLLESARFDPVSIRSTSRTLKLSSDSSYVFERGVDPVGVELASRRACQLIVEIAGGTLVEGVIAAGEPNPAPRDVAMRPDRCAQLLGYETPIDRIIDIFARLDLSPRVDDGRIICTIPPHRLDLEREADLIEEIARMVGFDRIEIQPDMHLTIRAPQSVVRAKRTIIETLIAHGYYETVTFSNLPVEQAEPFLDREGSLILMSEEQKPTEPALRPSILPSLLAVRKHNQDLGNHDVRLFEIAQVFAKKSADASDEGPGIEVALLADAPDQAIGLRDLKGVIAELTERLGLSIDFEPPKAELHPTWAGAATFVMHHDEVGRRIVGVVAAADAALCDRFDLQTPVALAWLDYQALISQYPPVRRVAEVPRFPGIERDLSVVVAERTPWAQIAAAIDEVSPELLEDVRFVGVYRGKQIGAASKSVTFRLYFRDPAKTLRHDEVDPQVNAVVEKLTSQVNGQLRTA